LARRRASSGERTRTLGSSGCSAMDTAPQSMTADQDVQPAYVPTLIGDATPFPRLGPASHRPAGLSAATTGFSL
jgi:hypothetical protein